MTIAVWFNLCKFKIYKNILLKCQSDVLKSTSSQRDKSAVPQMTKHSFNCVHENRVKVVFVSSSTHQGLKIKSSFSFN